MICKICEGEYCDHSQNVGTCPECLTIIIANSVDDEIDDILDAEEEEDDGTGDGEFGGGIVAEEGPEDEDLVTSDYATFFRFGMGKVAFRVPRDDDWQPHARAYMEKEQFWPNIWEAGERGGYSNITLEGP